MPANSAPPPADPIASSTVSIRLRDLARRLKGPSDEPDGTPWMLAGTVVAALGAYAFTMLGSRVLGADDYAPIAVLWSLQFLLVTIAYIPMEQLVIRETLLGTRDDATHRTARRVVLITVTLVAAISFGAHQRLFGDDLFIPVAAVALAASFGWYGLRRADMAADRDYRAYGMALSGEGIVRVVAAVPLLAVGLGARGLALAMIATPAGTLVIPRRRGAPSERDLGTRDVSSGRFAAEYIVANACAQSVLAGGPVAAAALGAQPAVISRLTILLTVLRLPIVLIYNLLARVLPAVVSRGLDQRRVGPRAMALLAGASVALVAVAAGLAVPVIPPAIALLFGADFRPGPGISAVLTAGVAAGLVAMAIQQILVARGATRRVAATWGMALIVAGVYVVAGPGSIEWRVAFAFLFGEAIGWLGNLVALSGVRLTPADATPIG